MRQPSNRQPGEAAPGGTSGAGSWWRQRGEIQLFAGVVIVTVALVALAGRGSWSPPKVDRSNAGQEAGAASGSVHGLGSRLPSDQLEVDGGRLCDRAFQTPTRGASLALPSGALLPGALLSLARGTDAMGGPAWTHPNVPGFPFGRPLDPARVKAVACIDPRSVSVGMYTSGGTAWRKDWDVRVLSWPDGEVLAGDLLQGGPPPTFREVPMVGGMPAPGAADASGPIPLEAFVVWLGAGPQPTGNR
jgi:hypothetical protein